MAGIQLRARSEQLADYLREELRGGRWCGWMPGVLKLEKELGVNRNTIEPALRILEKEGVLVAQGAGKRRWIELKEQEVKKVLRAGMLMMEPLDWGKGFMIDLMHRLQDAGHHAFFAEKAMSELGMDLGRIRRMIKLQPADAWIVVAGPRDVLEWFEGSEYPTFAIFGRRSGLRIAGAGPDKVPPTIEAVRRLVDLGHRRIILLNRKLRRIPAPGRVERAFLDALESHGIAHGPYNMPDWEETAGGFHCCLEKLFRHTPPTAIIADEVHCFLGAMQFCERRGLRVPEDVSLICTDADPGFCFFDPPVSHIHWEAAPIVRRVLRWAGDVAKGKDALRQSQTPARFIEGGTIGPREY